MNKLLFLFFAFSLSHDFSAQTAVWEKLSAPYGGTVQEFMESPDGTVYADGRYSSEDGGRSWLELPEGFHKLDEQGNPTKIVHLGAYFYGISKSGDKGQTWTTDTLQSDNGTPILQVEKDGVWYAYSWYTSRGHVLRSLNDGKNWEVVRAFPYDVYVDIVSFSPDGNMYIAISYFGKRLLYKSTNLGQDITLIFSEDVANGALRPFTTIRFLSNGDVCLDGHIRLRNDGADITYLDASGSSFFQLQSICEPTPGVLVGVINPSFYTSGQYLRSSNLYLSYDFGDTWIYQVDALPVNTSAWVLYALSNSTVLLSDYTFNGESIYRSEDNGQSWVLATEGMNNCTIERIIVNPKNLDVYAISIQGAWRSEDLGSTWTLLTGPRGKKYPVRNLSISTNGTLFTYWSNPDTSTQSGLYRSTDDGLSWQQINTSSSGLTGNNAKPASNVSVNKTTNEVYLISLGDVLLYSKDDGLTWQKDSTWKNYYGEYVFVSHNGDKFAYRQYSNTRYYRQLNGSSVWEQIDNLPNLRSFWSSPWGMLYATNNSGGLYQSEDLGFTWEPTSSPGSSSDKINRIIAEPSGFMYMSKGNKVYVSDDFGKSWANYSANLPNSIRTLALSEPVGGKIFVGGDYQSGLFSTDKIFPQIASIYGKIARDSNDNCQIDTGEADLKNWIVEGKINNVKNYTNSDNEGKYGLGFFVLDSSTVQATLDVHTPNNLWQSCRSPLTVNLSSTQDSIIEDFPIQTVADCPLLDVSIIAHGLRPFTSGQAFVYYKNRGTLPAPDAYIDISSTPPWILIDSVSVPFVRIDSAHIVIPIDDVPIDGSDFLHLSTQGSGAAQLGYTSCLSAHIYPDTFCGYTGSRLYVNAICKNDSILEFSIKNNGNAPSPNLLDYIVIEDQVILMQGQLPPIFPSDSITIPVVATGSTLRLEVKQEFGYPGHQNAAGWSEGCGTTQHSLGIINQYSCFDSEPFLDIDCIEVSNSYDPNEKKVLPKGVGPDHLVQAGTRLEYTLGFQNTGNDTAYLVVLKDTLSYWLDPASIRPGASSHPYTFELSGFGVATFRFEDIDLVDSLTDEPASHGWVEFEIDQKKNVPIGAVIGNRAGIYFDYNAPIITNTVWNTVGEDILDFVSVQELLPHKGSSLEISPNPASDIVQIKSKVLESQTGDFRLDIVSPLGGVKKSFFSRSPVFYFDSKLLPPGIYTAVLVLHKDIVGSERLVVLRSR